MLIKKILIAISATFLLSRCRVKEEVKVEETKQDIYIKSKLAKTKENISNDIVKYVEKNNVTATIYKAIELNKINEIKDIYVKLGKKYNLDYKLLLAISKKESNFNNLAINVNANKSNKDLIGSHKFKDINEAIDYTYKLDKLKLNYDAGISQINSNWRKYYKLENKDLFLIEKNVNLSARILRDNLNKYCNQDLTCALSVYNSGYKKSTIGLKYAEGVINNYEGLKLIKELN